MVDTSTTTLHEEARPPLELLDHLVQEVEKVFHGKQDVVRLAVAALLARGHILFEDVPGVGKTTLSHALAKSLGLGFRRIQFTSDLLPSDVLGVSVYNPQTSAFETRPGPIFTNVIVADEINRAPAKVQSGLLEAMQEHQVTLGGTAYALPDPFLVMATQNPVEQEGTYPLPEAQVDRFLFKLIVDYPSESNERLMMSKWGQVTESPKVGSVSSPSELLELREYVDKVHVSEELMGYMLSLVRETRKRVGDSEDDGIEKVFSFGASPRASLALVQASRAMAFLRGQAFVTPDVVQEIFLDVLRHRVGLTYEAEASNKTPDEILLEILRTTPIPGSF